MNIIAPTNIITEKDPILREIWVTGYTHVIEDVVNWEMVLINKPKKYEKTICLHEYRKVIMEIIFMRGCNISGNMHTWITEKDGSANRFRELIN